MSAGIGTIRGTVWASTVTSKIAVVGVRSGTVIACAGLGVSGSTNRDTEAGSNIACDATGKRSASATEGIGNRGNTGMDGIRNETVGNSVPVAIGWLRVKSPKIKGTSMDTAYQTDCSRCFSYA